MKKYTVCICDDEQLIRDKLKKYILRYSFAYDVEIDLIELDAAEKLYDLTNPYDILFLDAPFRGLDKETEQKVIEYTNENCTGRTVIFVTHKEEEARRIGAVQIIKMKE